MKHYSEIRDTKYDIRATSHGFTLVELLVALIVSSVILAAVATLAFAMSTANVSTDDTSIKQAQVRYATLRISELIRHCKLIYAASDSYITIWKVGNGDNVVDLDELVSIEAGEDADYIQLREPGTDPVVLVTQCKDVLFGLYDSNYDDSRALPLKTKYVSITFKIFENGIEHQYQISNALRCWAGNLLNGGGDAIVSDDD
jgi:prepilin-type N-terminal cleavage/methylation domain-containing protein